MREVSLRVHKIKTGKCEINLDKKGKIKSIKGYCTKGNLKKQFKKLKELGLK